MLAPTLTAHTDLQRHHVAISVHGPLATADHGQALIEACLPLPATYGLLVNLSNVTTLTEAGMCSLRDLAKAVAESGHRIAFVCSELILRSELILGDLDMPAPVLQADEQALPLVGFAA